MTYGKKGWAEWVLEDDEALEHFKVAYDVRKVEGLSCPGAGGTDPGHPPQLGINSWDTGESARKTAHSRERQAADVRRNVQPTSTRTESLSVSSGKRSRSTTFRASALLSF